MSADRHTVAPNFLNSEKMRVISSMCSGLSSLRLPPRLFRIRCQKPGGVDQLQLALTVGSLWLVTTHRYVEMPVL